MYGVYGNRKSETIREQRYRLIFSISIQNNDKILLYYA